MYSRFLSGTVRPVSRLHPTRCGVLYMSTEINRKVGALKSDSTQSARLVTVRSSERNSKKKKSWNCSPEWKLASLCGVAYLLNEKMNRQQRQKAMKLKRVKRQLKYLYGPLYTNRLISDASYRNVVANQGLEEYLREARLKKDADMIYRWRSCVFNVLYPSDIEAVDMISKNAHLNMTEEQSSEEFEKLVDHTVNVKIVMKRWKADDGTLLPAEDFTADDYLEVNNAIGMEYRTLFLEHVRNKYKQLGEKNEEIMSGGEQQIQQLFLYYGTFTKSE